MTPSFLLIGEKKRCLDYIKKILNIRETFYKFDLRVFFFFYKGISARLFLLNLNKKTKKVDKNLKKIKKLKIDYTLYLLDNFVNQSYPINSKKNFFIYKSKFNFFSNNFFYIKYNKNGFLFIIEKLFNNLRKKEKIKKIYVPIIGFKNVGKTTLINSLFKENILISSKKPGNTKNISTLPVKFKKKYIIFFDFPGFKKKINITKLNILENFYGKINIIVFMVSIGINKKEKKIIEKLKKKYIVIICINKLDKIIYFKNDNIYSRFLICKISAKKKINIKKMLFLIYKTFDFIKKKFKKKFLINNLFIKVKKEKFSKIKIISKTKNKKKIFKYLKIKENFFNYS
ncbi:GTPase domain-containing protein [Candidatus Vidania fulgoroideorum]